MKEKEYPLGVTEAQLKQWKAKYGEVHLVDVPMEGGTVYGYFRKPSLEVVSAAGKFAESDPVKSALIVYEGCKLKADASMDDEGEAKLAAAKRLVPLFKMRQAGIKKL